MSKGKYNKLIKELVWEIVSGNNDEKLIEQIKAKIQKAEKQRKNKLG